MSQPRRRARAPRTAGRATAAFQDEWRAVKADNKVALAGFIKDRTGYHGRPCVALRHPGQAPARVQAAAPERAVPDHAVQPAQADRGRSVDAADGDLRRQGRTRIPDGQADHQADQFGRHGDQPGPEGLASAQGRLSARLQRQGRPARLSRPPISPSRSRPPGKRHRAPAT